MAAVSGAPAVSVEVVSDWPWAVHPHQHPAYYRAMTGGVFALRCAVGRSGVIVPLWIEDDSATSRGYGGPIWWGMEASAAMDEVMAWLEAQGVDQVDLRAAPTGPLPPLPGVVRDLGPTVVIPVREPDAMLAAMNKSVRRSIRRSEEAGFVAKAEQVGGTAGPLLAEFADLHESQLGEELGVDSLFAMACGGLDVVLHGVVAPDGSMAGAQVALGYGAVVEIGTALAAREWRAASPLKMADALTLEEAWEAGRSVVHVGGAAGEGEVTDGLMAYKMRLGGEVRSDLCSHVELGGS